LAGFLIYADRIAVCRSRHWPGFLLSRPLSCGERIYQGSEIELYTRRQEAGGHMFNTLLIRRGLPTILLAFLALPAGAQSFRVQCPTSTITHPVRTTAKPNLPVDNNSEPAYAAVTTFATDPTGAYLVPTANVNGAIKCQQISGGDGYASMGDGTQTYMFSFGPLSGIASMAKGLPGTQFPNVFNVPYTGVPLAPGDPATTDAPDPTMLPQPLTAPAFTYDGAIGQVPDADVSGSPIDGHVDPRQIMDVGVMNGNIPAPLMAIDEDDEFFLTLTNVGMIMRPDLFEQHTVHFHGYPNASSFYDGVPDASVAINIGASFTYYYLAPDAGTYFWHCHISPPEHLQMGMVGQIYVRPRQNRVASGTSLYAGLVQQQLDLRTACNSNADILCSNPLPADLGVLPGATAASVAKPGVMYAYNDGDGSTAYDVEYPLQIHGFDPNFHFVGMTFNPEMFVDMKDKFFLLNGRSYPDTVTPGPMATESSDGRVHYSQPLPSIINIPAGGRALLRIADLSVTEYATLATLGIPMIEVGFNAKLLRDQTGNNQAFYTNSITLGGGESLDVILDASDAGCGSTGCAATLYPPGSVFYLYTPQLDHLSNDQENFGGLMTEVHICNSVTGGNTYGNTCN
jgi:FtsP/CotA-like multicopper oxidase with cupredoxin domain